MSRDFMNDYLEHSWGKKPEQKAREKAYNAEYYQKHKDKWKKYDSWLHDSNAPNRRASEAAAENEKAKAKQNMTNREVLTSTSRKRDTSNGVKNAVTTAGKIVSATAAARLGISPLANAALNKGRGKYAAESIKLGKKFVSDLLDKIF